MNLTIIILITLLFSALFSGMEIAFVSANKLRIELERKQGSFSSGVINLFMKQPSLFIATMLVGNNIALVIYGIEMAVLLEPFIQVYVSSQVSIVIIQTLISTIIILITAEFIPKALFRINPNLLLNIFSLPVSIFFFLFYPISKFSIWLSIKLLKLTLHVDITDEKSQMVFGKLDLDNLISEGQDEKLADDEIEHDLKIFQNALDFSDVKLRDCMIPRTEIVALDVNDSIENLTNKFISTGLSRILIYKDSIDNIIGYVKSSELFKNPKSIKSKLTSLPIVPESMLANKMLEIFTKERKNIAVVVDEFGGTSGMLTIEDIIEEIFGEIEDEHDKIDFIDVQVNEKEFIFSGRLEIDYINEKYKLGIEESEEFNTIAGLILSHCESIPEKNEIVRFKNFEAKIEKVSNTRIELINIKIID